MKNVELFKKHYKRLARESLIKSILFGCLIGFFALFSSALIFWLADFSFFWIAIIISIIITFTISFVSYYRLFKPTKKQLAIRLDELGLEERMLTMEELKNDNSYIAKLQREDTIKHLETVKPNLIKLIISIPLVISVFTSGLLGIDMITISALAANDVINSGKDLIDNHVTKFYDVSYEVEGDGEIFGDIVQRIEEGKSTSSVVAIANDGFVFVGWSDGLTSSERTDLNITEDFVVTAIFEELDEEDDSEEDSDSEDSSEDPNNPENSSGNSDHTSNDTNGGSQSNWKDNDTIIDGSTNYDDYLDEAKKDAENGSKDNSNLDKNQKDSINDYFNNIRK